MVTKHNHSETHVNRKLLHVIHNHTLAEAAYATLLSMNGITNCLPVLQDVPPNNMGQ
jgi:hypothetical protein